MSAMIECDKCHKLMYQDSRTPKGAYCTVGVTDVMGYSIIHLCKTCYRQFRVEFIRDMTPEEFDEYYGEDE